MEKFVIGAALVTAGVFAVSAMVGGSVMHIDVSDDHDAPVPEATAPAPVGKPQTYAATRLKIEDAAVLVTILPEDRADISVEVAQAGKLPALDANLRGDELVLDGRLGSRIRGCGGDVASPSITVSGYGDLSGEEVPKITVRTPKAAAVALSGAVYGTIGPSKTLTLVSGGCGELVVGDVAETLELNANGSGTVALGKAGAAKVRLSGSGDATLADVASGLEAAVAGSGTITAESVNGALDARIAGSGDIGVDGGAITSAKLEITGSGDITVDAVVATLAAQVIGSGDIDVREVTGSVSKEVMGSGDIRVDNVRAPPAPPAPPAAPSRASPL